MSLCYIRINSKQFDYFLKCFYEIAFRSFVMSFISLLFKLFNTHEHFCFSMGTKLFLNYFLSLYIFKLKKTSCVLLIAQFSLSSAAVHIYCFIILIFIIVSKINQCVKRCLLINVQKTPFEFRPRRLKLKTDLEASSKCFTILIYYVVRILKVVYSKFYVMFLHYLKLLFM